MEILQRGLEQETMDLSQKEQNGKLWRYNREGQNRKPWTYYRKNRMENYGDIIERVRIGNHGPITGETEKKTIQLSEDE